MARREVQRMSEFRRDYGLRAERFALRDFFINRPNRARLVRHDMSLVASDCTGGVLSHDLRLRFNSPTVNFFFMAEDYLRFVTAPERYLTERMEPVVDSGYDYPVAQLADIRLYLVHYASIAEAQAAWDRRAARLDLTHAWYILNDRNEFTEEHLARFDALPLEHKVCFVHRHDWAERYASAYYIRGFEQQDEVGTMTAFPGKINIRRNVDQFDYVSWFNSGQWQNRS